MKNIKTTILLMGVLLATALTAQSPGQNSKKNDEEGVRLKDLARISGVRTNQLIGYGLVVGLPGTGDSRSKMAQESMQNVLGNLGQKLEASSNARNIAAVLVTAEVPAFAKKGDRIDVTVSSIGDAKSLEGGVLIQTPLKAATQDIYVVSQGVISTGGKSSERERAGKTVGTIVNGGSVERDIDAKFVEENPTTGKTERKIRIGLNRFDFSTLNEVRNQIQKAIPSAIVAPDGGSLLVTIPDGIDTVQFIAQLEEVRVVPKYKARIVINERTGTIVMGGDIRIDPVAVSRGGIDLTVTGKSDEQMGIHILNQMKGDAKDSSAVTKQLSGTSIQEIIDALNKMGAGVKDIIAILEALQDSGALHAEVVVI